MIKPNKTKIIQNDKKNNLYSETEVSEKDFQFSSLSFNEWYKIVQYVINYDIIYSNLEYLEHLNLRLDQLNLFIDSKGLIPHDVKEVLDQLEKKYDEIVHLKKQLSLLENDNDQEVCEINKQELIKIEEIVKKEALNKNPDLSKQTLLYFNNPYFLKGDNQYFNERLKSLLDEKKIIISNIKTISSNKKKYLRNLNVFENQIKKILFDQNFDFKRLFFFVRPYINQILTTDDYYYAKLVEKTMFD